MTKFAARAEAVNLRFFRNAADYQRRFGMFLPRSCSYLLVNLLG